MKRALFAVAVLSLLSCAHTRGATVQRPLTAEDFARVVSIPEAAVSHDGLARAWVSDSTGARELWLNDAGNDEGAVQLTHAKGDVGGVSFSPDGSIIYAEDYGGDDRFDLWVVERGSKAPRRLTESKAVSEEGAEFSPDGTKLAYLSDPDQPFRLQVIVRDLASGKVRQLTRTDLIHAALKWSPDGRTLVATRTGDFQRGSLVVLDVESGAERLIAPPMADGITYAAGFLPDGTLLARSLNEKNFMQLLHVDVTSGQQRFVGPGDWDVDEAVVAKTGAIAFLRNVHAQSELLVSDGVAGLAHPRVLEQGGLNDALAIDDSGKVLVAVAQTARQPESLVCHDLARGTRSVCVPPETGGIDLARLPEAKMRTFRSFDGVEIDALVLTPIGVASPSPAVVLVHGGPNGQTRPYFKPFSVAIADAGFTVIQPNYRGSTGYGRAFEDLNNKDWCGGDYKDLVAVVEALAKSGEIDSRRGVLKARGVPVEYVVYPDEGHGFTRREHRLDAMDRTVRFLRARLGRVDTAGD